MPKCDYCGKEFYAGDGAWDDGDYTCGECLADQIEEFERKESERKKSEVPLFPRRNDGVAKKWSQKFR